MFTTANGKCVMLKNSRIYKNHVIEKVEGRALEYYTVDKAGMFWKLRDAKKAIDNKEA